MQDTWLWLTGYGALNCLIGLVWVTSFTQLKVNVFPYQVKPFHLNIQSFITEATLCQEKVANKLVIGSRMIPNDWDEEPTLGAVESLIEKAKTMLPGVMDMKINAVWAGLRPQTFDEKPFIGKHPEYDEILFATGHSRNGVLLAPATGEMIRDLILGKAANAAWVEAFKVDRCKTAILA